MILLAEVLLPEVVGVVSTPVAPLKDLVGGHVDVLEVLVLAVALLAGPGDGEPVGALGERVSHGQRHGHVVAIANKDKMHIRVTKGFLDGQQVGSFDYDQFQWAMAVNTFGPMAMAAAFKPHVAASEQKKIVTLTSGLASLTMMSKMEGMTYYLVIMFFIAQFVVFFL